MILSKCHDCGKRGRPGLPYGWRRTGLGVRCCKCEEKRGLFSSFGNVSICLGGPRDRMLFATPPEGTEIYMPVMPLGLQECIYRRTNNIGPCEALAWIFEGLVPQDMAA